MSRSLIAILFLLSSSCFYYEDIPRTPEPPVCTGSDLALTASAQSSSGCGKLDGTITVTATGGSAAYSFSKDGGTSKQQSGTFSGLAGGTYQITVFDATGCSAVAEVVVPAAGSTLNASANSVQPDTGCSEDNGAISFTASGGDQPYTYKVGTVTNSTGVFSGLAGGVYNAMITDAASCSINFSVTVPIESTVSYAADIAPLLTAKCNFSTCHGSRSGGDLTTYESVKANAADIKSRTASGNMPKAPRPGGSLTAEQIELIACWVDSGAKNN